MPRGNRTGPMGMGPRTGRGLGYCAGYDEPGYMQAGSDFGYGRGMAWRRGRGRGLGLGRRIQGAPWGMAYPAPEIGPEHEVAALKSQASWLEEQLSFIQKRLADLSESSGDEA